jgi:D-amino-acid oxidase
MPPNPGRTIAIIGGGISGLTTAVLLQIVGYRTVVYTRMRPSYEANAARPPEFATPHAAASILPHSVASPNVARWTGISQAFFRTLSFPGSCGVRSQVHYEIFEDPVPVRPAYAGSVENFQHLTPVELEENWAPRRTGAKATHGWKFDAFFCDAPEYLSYLDTLYRAAGGCVRDAPGDNSPGDGSLSAYLGLGHDFHINCAGAAAYSLLSDNRVADAPTATEFEPLIDPVPPKLIRGHYLRVDIKQVPAGRHGRFFSYNYKPTADIYRTASGASADVYCYPRSDAWILGGSRQEGRVDANGNWDGEQTVGKSSAFSRRDAPPLAVPSAILELNSDILQRMTGGHLNLARLVRDDPSIVAPAIGYRFVRDSDTDSVRIGCSRVEVAGVHKYILHNYGHGGSGFTLSWGCAFDILRRLQLMTKPAAPPAPGRFALHHAAMRQMLAGLTNRLLESPEQPVLPRR